MQFGRIYKCHKLHYYAEPLYKLEPKLKPHVEGQEFRGHKYCTSSAYGHKRTFTPWKP